MREAKVLAGLHNAYARMSHRCSLKCDEYQNLFVLDLLCLLLEYHTLCMQNAKALAKLCKCLGSYEPSLLINVISDQNLLCWPTLVPYFVNARREGSGGAARMHRLVGVIAARQWDKYQNLLCWPTCVCVLNTATYPNRPVFSVCWM